MVRKHHKCFRIAECCLSLPLPGLLDLCHAHSRGIEGLFKPLGVFLEVVELILGGPLRVAFPPNPTSATPCPSGESRCIVAVFPASASAVPKARSGGWSLITSRRSTFPGTTAPANPSARHRSLSSRTGSVSTRHVSSSLSKGSSSSTALANRARFREPPPP